MPTQTQAAPSPARSFPGVLSAYDFDTTPGARSALAPPPGWDGDREAYHAVIRRRYKNDPEVRQCILVAALRSNLPFGERALRFQGPYAAWGREVILSTARHLRAGRQP